MATGDLGEASLTKVTVAMLGARRHYAVPRLLHEAGLLERFFTDSYSGNKPWLERALKTIPPRIQPQGLQRWLGRRDAVLPPHKVTSFETLGIRYAWAQRRIRDAQELEKVYRNTAVQFAERISSAGFGDAAYVWGYNGAALELFKAAKAQGLRCILEQTSNPKPIERTLIQEEYARWPDWALSAPGMRHGELLEERERQEWQLADCIVGGSEFVAAGLKQCGVPEGKIRVVPYGVDMSRFALNTPLTPKQRSGPLRVLFVGRISVMKGIPDLLHALALLGPNRVHARLIGGGDLTNRKLQPFSEVAEIVGYVPRTELAAHYRWAEVFCFPSLTEGSATVTYEALMSGVPVIATPNAGAPVRDGVDGLVVPIRDPQALADALQRYLDDPDLLSAHQTAAAQDRHRLGLDAYRERLVDVVQGLACA